MSPGLAFPGADPPGRFQPIHIGHLHIHQHQVEDAVGEFVQGLGSISGDRRAVSALFQQAHREFLVVEAVFGQQHAQSSQFERFGTDRRRLRQPGVRQGRELQQAGDGVEQVGGRDRLGEAGVGPRPVAARGVGGTITRVNEQQRVTNLRGVRPANVIHEFETRPFRQAGVDNREQKVRLGSAEEQGGGLRGGRALGDLHPPARQDIRQDLADTRVVVDHQHLRPPEGGMPGDKPGGRGDGNPQPGGEVEHAPLGLAGLVPDAAPLQFDQAGGDRQAETGPSIAARHRGVGLFEGEEQAVALPIGNTNAGVGDSEVEHQFVTQQRLGMHPDANLPVGGELDGVPHQVDQHLPEPGRVSQHPFGDPGVDVIHNLQRLAMSLQGQRFERGPQAVAEMEFDLLEIEFLGFDLREIEDVVDE